ncbi:MAG: PilZ domain-containing protein [Gammaproteobacteria bacterium]|nr:PilZ domain-containing protein [Gammaproteobacteria bacterium]
MIDDQPQEDLNQDRRQFFRVDDSVSLSYQEIPEASLKKKLEHQQKDLDYGFTIMSSLGVITQEMAGVLRKIEVESPDIARYLKSLDSKVDLLGRAFLAWTTELADQPVSAVNLSASGIAFDSPTPVTVGVVLELKLLLPSFTGLIVYAEVIACKKMDEAPSGDRLYQTRVQFIHLRENDRDVLIRHVLKRQSQMLRKRREQAEGTAESGLSQDLD